MTPLDIDRIRQVDDFESLVVFLRDELEWPLQAEDIEELSFDYEPAELGLSEEVAVKINSIKQLRPLAENQPWGIFYIDFEPKKLPVVVLRRVLQKLVVKKRSTSQRSNRPGWQMNDLLFINSFGEQDERAVTFAHFRQEDENQLPTLKVIGWDGQDTPLHLDRCQNELGYLRFDPDIDAETWRTNWSAAFTTTHRHSINTSKRLAKELAELARVVRTNAAHILKYETEGGRFKMAMAKFKTALIHDLAEEDFADMYAQTIAYGLLYTAIRSHVSGEATVVSTERVQQLVLPTNPFLKEVMEGFFNIGARKWDSEKEMITGIEFDELGINEIITILKDKRTDFDAILRDFGNKNPNEDPVIHFYELFLKEYDALKRKSRGVYYTPRPVVSFIVSSVDEILRKDFGLKDGLADTTTWGQMHKNNPDIKIPSDVSKDDFFVQILDPALGTGTFLVDVIDTIAITMKTKWGKELGLSVPADPNDVVAWKHPQVLERWNNYVPQCLLPRLYGFELMMAPYAIAHMKIGIKLFETGYQNFQQDNKRVRVYLTNTLEEPVDTTEYLDTLDPAMAEETRQANEIKNKNSITIVIGNPPYSYMSAHLSKQQRDQVEVYKYVNGQRIKERGALQFELNLQDDYVKFIRFAEKNSANVEVGIVGMITNHSYFSNITLRGMRKHLLETFSNIYLLNLHGNAKVGSQAPDGTKDYNVFNIQQGVGISLFSLIPQHGRKHKVRYAEKWGSRESKLRALSNQSSNIEFERIAAKQPEYLFVPRNEELADEYYKFYPLNEIFLLGSTGVMTNRDGLTIEFEQKKLEERISLFVDLKRTDEEIAEKLNIKENVVWSINEARSKLSHDNWVDDICDIHYRPFDIRKIIYNRAVVDNMREPVMSQIDISQNLTILVSRQQLSPGFRHIFVTNQIFECCLVSLKSREKTSGFPLYARTGELYGQDIHSNIHTNFIKTLEKTLNTKYAEHSGSSDDVTPELLFYYIYSILHSCSYRMRYEEFLKVNFPRIPLPQDHVFFQKLAELGEKLIALHLMESDKLKIRITTFPVAGGNAVSKVGEKGKTLADLKNGKGKLYINKTQYFDGLPEEVWNFHMGGYQVCYKWLYDRKKAGRKLSTDDIEHYHKIVVTLSETIKIMNQIDELIAAHGGWPIK